MQPNRGVRLVLIILFTLLTGYLGLQLAELSFKVHWYEDAVSHFTFKGKGELVKLLIRVLFALLGLLAGFLSASKMIRRVAVLGHTLEETPPRDKVAMILGLTLSLGLTALLAFLFYKLIPDNDVLPVLLTLFSFVVTTYLFVSATMSMSNEMWSIFFAGRAPGRTRPVMQHVKVLDTNVIIDGRIADVAGSGFLEGTLYVPGFVLDELQYIADSSDPLKRARGRRGLEILNEMQKQTLLVVRDFDNVDSIHPSDPVDQKLILLAKHLEGAIVTNDFNLNKVAELQGVRVLNINELANAVKPVVLPGEEMIVQIIKEGKEANQGVGYLDDGTMIVVEGGRRHIGEHLHVVVSSVLQTVAGKMIFSQIRDADDPARAFRTERPVRVKR